MPHKGCLVLSLVSMVIGILYFLCPQVLLKTSQWLNRMAKQPSDERILRYRYLIGLLWFAFSYGLFKLALVFADNPLTLLVPFS